MGRIVRKKDLLVKRNRPRRPDTQDAVILLCAAKNPSTPIIHRGWRCCAGLCRMCVRKTRAQVMQELDREQTGVAQATSAPTP